ncbi:Periplasmic pH-dependent serine endoprotease DegQ [Bacteroides pyogenes]|uniref:Do family serine endopeptidase n=1 Tax=Bacteroides pyogenes TaxID=310300 RepID=UPI001BA986ED|nr:Do family serine endopeptidase [Bacteroides pyogenes]MBR8719141.1 Periplasmic pH-dependent serine endoprotease DegQ [Bacteroides pyogenes]MBR8724063.1 Periplasmic pH-dependent serine endoprotease DegQ [Bacteroides pyogenes]MBR8737612.1 Periplasmic pH-dependent serine endoprotease DegQ [Bacteroides pyogenes]MBR8753187.1 Periplasmic pH-dependent serine endoprotease DegQ [Bacteroides pyogenes]MBR8786018.1 Periplasmic pH-dependent serine endoprotease DegQ [Bacteroides pyogenes]
MKQTTRNILGIGAIILLSSGVAGLTTYKLMQAHEESKEISFNDLFKQNSNVKLAAFDAVSSQPVDLTQAAENSLHAVVHIKSTQESKTKTIQQAPDIFDFFFGDGRGQQRQIQTQPRVGFGSGVIISKDGYIVTNNHVVEGADEISVKLNDNREFKGRIIGSDPGTDLALVKVEADDLPTIPVGDSDALKVGEWVLAVGNPFNLTSTVTAGIVSAKARTLGVYNGGIESFIQTDAAINQGNSGGALVNARGELVGINSVLSSPTGAYAGYGFAIPTSIMTKVVSDLKKYGTVQRALLGIRGGSITDEQFSDELKKKAKELGVVEGVLVAEVIDGGSASGADIKVDDVIIGIDNKRVKNMADLQESLAKHRPGDKVKVKLIRNKKEKTVEVLLKNEQGTTKIVKDAGMEVLGAAFKELSDDLKKQLNLGYGLQVTGVSSGKMADAGIRKGFIILRANDQPLRKVSDLEEVLKAAVKSPNQVLFLTGVFPSGKRGYFAVDLTQD